MVVVKEVKDYGRQRIDINKKDGFNEGDKVVVLKIEDYQNIKKKLFNLQITLNKCETKLKTYDNMDLIIENTIEKTLNAIMGFKE